MEIYKQKITDLKQGVKNPNRVNVFVDGKFAFSLDVTQVVDFKIKVGKLITPEELLEYQKASEFGKLYQRALEWVLVRPRSEKEAYDYLYKKVYEKKLDKNYINNILEKLKDRKYLDDFKFAEWYVENRFVKKGVSVRRLKMELMKKGIEKSIIEEILSASDRNDKDEILKIIAKKRAKYDDEKLIAYLCRQGFSFELASELVRSSGTD
ncbi:RecX family transcriptional regulator [Candidatus Saccharibacteria bacterium]|nr:RecX family transcriptional regulator [Candidatus Saccharibacteria bacterium]